MSCNNCYNSSCDSTCGCPQQVKGTCVFYQGANLNCLDVTKGDTYDSILVTLNDLICNLNPPSGIATVVTGCSSITVTKNPSADIYNVCLSSATQSQINTNTTNVATLLGCLTTTVANITVDSSLKLTSAIGPCGRNINLSVNFPAPPKVYDGIIYNNTDKDGTTGGAGDKTLKDFNWNYILNNLIADKDEIRFEASGQVKGDATNADYLKIQLYNNATSTPIRTDIYKAFTPDPYYSWKAIGSITVTDQAANEGLYNLELFIYARQNGTRTTVFPIEFAIDADITGIDYSDLSIKVIYDHKSTSGATINFARKLMVEVRKYLS